MDDSAGNANEDASADANEDASAPQGEFWIVLFQLLDPFEAEGRVDVLFVLSGENCVC